MLKLISTMLVTAIFLTGCISAKSYIDPKYGDVGYDDVAATNETVKVDVEFLRNGEAIKAGREEAEPLVRETLETAGFNVSDAETATPVFSITINNIVDTDAAFGKGFGTGLTMGLAGTAVSDFYDITISFTQGDKTVEQNYEHAIHSTIGNASAPVENAEAMAPIDAFAGVIEDVILQFIIDMQAEAVGDPIAAIDFIPRIVG